MSASTQSKHLACLLSALESRDAAASLVAMRRDDADCLSGAELAGKIRRLASGLIDAGLSPRDRVVFIAENSPQQIAALLAVIVSDGVAVPLDVQMENDTLGDLLADCQPRFLFTTGKHAKRLLEIDAGLASKIYLLDAASEEDASEGAGNSENDPDLPNYLELEKDVRDSGNDESPIETNSRQSGWEDPAVLFYTSGTTGAPKGVPLTHGNLLTQIETIRHADLVHAGDRVLLPLPLHHVYPLVIGLLAPISLGLPVILPRSLTGPDILRALQAGKASFIIGVPRLYQALYEAILSRVEQQVGKRVSRFFVRMLGMVVWVRKRIGFSWGVWIFRWLRRRIGPSLRVLASGGSPLDPELGWKLEGLGWSVAIGYGLTETSPLLTINPPGAGHLQTVGKPIDAIELRIDHEWRKNSPAAQADADQADAENGSDEAANVDTKPEGEILARGASVFAGYWNAPDKNETSFTEDGWFRTGDLGYLDRHNRLHVTGRVSTLIITQQGEKVQPDEIEAVFDASAEIRELAVLQRDGGLVGVAVPETAELTRDVDPEQQVREAVKRINPRLASFKQLREVVVTRHALPRTRLGKLRRHLLEARFHEAKHDDESSQAEPISKAEMSAGDQTLLDQPRASQTWELLKKRFEHHPLTPDSSLRVELGLDSMAWLNLTMEILHQTGVQLDDEKIAEIETVRELLQAVEQQSEGDHSEDLLDHPEEILSARQRRRLRPLGRVGGFVAAQGQTLNRRLVRWYFHLEIEGGEQIPANGPLVLAANHLSSLDPFVLSAALDQQRLQQTYWAAWVKATERNPFRRLASRLAKTVPIDPQRGAISSLAFGAAVLQRDGILVWFPEGRRSRSGELMPFRQGIGLLLKRHRVPVVPVYIEGTFEALPAGARLPKRRIIKVRFGAVTQPEELEQPAELEREGQADGRAERIVAGLHHAVANLMPENSHR